MALEMTDKQLKRFQAAGIATAISINYLQLNDLFGLG
jgi:hypothetical protein